MFDRGEFPVVDDANVEGGEDGTVFSRLFFTADVVDGFSSSILAI